MRIGYVVKRYPRFSETFIVNEIIAHERAGVAIDIFPVRPTVDTHFQNRISQVRAAVRYLSTVAPKTQRLWDAMSRATRQFASFQPVLAEALSTEEPLNFFQAIELASEVRRLRIDHLHAHFGTAATSVARMAAMIAGVTYSFTAHAKDIFHTSVDPGDLRRKLRDAASVITVSDFNLQYLRDHYGVDAGRVRRIYNGLCLEDFPYRSPVNRRAHVLAVGRLVEKKGFDVLIEACARLVRAGVDLQCSIVGAGDEEAKLNTLIRERELVGRVELCGPRPQADVVQLVYDSAVFVAPSVTAGDGDRDGMPTVLLEAMALGTPCVGTAVTGIPEVVSDGATGLVVPQRDPDALAAAIQRLLEGGDLRERFSMEARKLIESTFNVENSTERMRELFENAIESRLGNEAWSREAVQCE